MTEFLEQIEEGSREAFVAACALAMVSDDDVAEGEIAALMKHGIAASSTAFEELRKFETPVFGETPSVEDYAEAIKTEKAEDSAEAQPETSQEDIANLVEDFSSWGLVVVHEVVNAWNEAKASDTELELIDLIVAKIGQNMAPMITMACLEVCLADGTLDTGESLVLGEITTKWGTLDEVNNYLEAATGTRFTTVEAHGRTALVPLTEATRDRAIDFLEQIEPNSMEANLAAMAVAAVCDDQVTAEEIALLKQAAAVHTAEKLLLALVGITEEGDDSEFGDEDEGLHITTLMMVKAAWEKAKEEDDEIESVNKLLDVVAEKVGNDRERTFNTCVRIVAENDHWPGSAYLVLGHFAASWDLGEFACDELSQATGVPWTLSRTEHGCILGPGDADTQQRKYESLGLECEILATKSNS